MCLQELKATNTEFPGEATRQAGYHAVYRGESCGNGVAILARWTPVVTRMDLPGDDGDRQCRYLEAAINDALVASIYAPIGNPQPGSEFDYKFAWLKHRTPTRLNCTRVQRRSCWREITTLCRQTSTFTKRSPGIMTPFCSPRAARRINAFSRKAGSIPFARSIQRADVHLTST